MSDFGTCLVCLIASEFSWTSTWADIQTNSTCVHSAWMLCINVNISHRRTRLLFEWIFCDCLTSVEKKSMFHFKLQMLLLLCLFLVHLDSMSPAFLGICLKLSWGHCLVLTFFKYFFLLPAVQNNVEFTFKICFYYCAYSWEAPVIPFGSHISKQDYWTTLQFLQTPDQIPPDFFGHFIHVTS